MKTSKVTFKQLDAVAMAIQSLKRLDIVVDVNGGDASVKVMHQDAPDHHPYQMLAEEKAKDTWQPFVSTKEKCILALAITQECQNEHINEFQIAEVNNFFEFEKPITYEQVQEYNRKYI
jgi:hypothetical protein